MSDLPDFKKLLDAVQTLAASDAFTQAQELISAIQSERETIASDYARQAEINEQQAATEKRQKEIDATHEAERRALEEWEGKKQEWEDNLRKECQAEVDAYRLKMLAALGVQENTKDDKLTRG